MMSTPSLTPDLVLRTSEANLPPRMESPVSTQLANDSTLLANDSGSYLKRLEDAEALEYLPVLILLGVMAVVGNVGNGVALYVYYTRFTPSSTRTYILAMSVFDLLFCSVSLPGEVLDLRFPYTYDAKWICRLHRLISVSLTLVSAMTLVAVALDRRRKICFPFRPQCTSRQVSLSVVGCLVASVVIGFPFAVMNGRHSVETEVAGVVGSACSVDDAFIDTSFPLIYNGILLLIFLACVVAMSVSYAQIARKIVTHKRKSLVGSRGALRGLALLMAKHPPGQDTDTQQSSSHFDGSVDLEVNHHRAKITPSGGKFVQTSGDSKIDDDVFVSQTSPENQVHGKKVVAVTPNSPSERDSSTGHTVKKPEQVSWNVKKREEELEMAVNTLVHAVSADMLHSSELFNTPTPCPLNRSRSASLQETSLSRQRKRIPETAPDPSKPLTSTKVPVNDVKSSDVKTAMMSSKSDDNDDGCQNMDNETGEKENVSEANEEKQRKRIERNTSTKRNEERRDKGIQRNTSLKSSVRSKNGDDHARHVTISESRSERLQSFVHHTLTRIKPRTHSADDGVTSTSSVTRRHWRKKISSRTTWMMFVLTAIFIISYLPYLTIVCVRAASHDIELGLQGWKLNLYTLGLKSYFINSIVNPFVYSFCSARFRHQCRYLFRSRPKMSISD